MKLIIDIPDNVYGWVMNTGKFGIYRYDTAKAIKNGIPLDSVKAEIEQTAKDYDKFDDYRRVRGLWIALEIIDSTVNEVKK